MITQVFWVYVTQFDLQCNVPIQNCLTFFFKHFFVFQALDLLYMIAFIDYKPIDVVFGMISIP